VRCDCRSLGFLINVRHVVRCMAFLVGSVFDIPTLQVLEAQMLPTTAPFYVGLAAGVAMFARHYVEYSGRSKIFCWGSESCCVGFTSKLS
jgi:hypothetical protein